MSKNSETHSVCNKHNIGGKSVCCECSGKKDCSNDAPTPFDVLVEEMEELLSNKKWGAIEKNYLYKKLTHTAHAVREATLKEQKDSLMGLVVKNCVDTNGGLWNVDMDSLERDLATLSTNEYD